MSNTQWPPRRQDCAEEGGQWHESRMADDGLDADEAVLFSAPSRRMALDEGEKTRRTDWWVNAAALLFVAAIAAWAIWG